jgi:SSS family transporter
MAGLSAPDLTVIALYLAAVAFLGFWLSGGQKSTRDYFLGGRSLPWWAAALSFVATENSAVTFIGFPAAAFTGDWQLLQLFLGIALGRVFVALVFVRVFYQEEYLTVYAYLAKRFGPKTRAAAAAVFLLGRVVASGVRLYAGCLAVHVVTEIPAWSVILVLGTLGTTFTLTGGIRAVVWTDVVLGITFTTAAVVSVFHLLGGIPGGLGEVLAQPDLAEKIRIFHPSWALDRENSLFVGLLGGFFLTLATHGTDQDMAQRMLTCRDARGGSLSVLGNAAMILPLVTVFLAVGTLLWSFHQLGSPGYEVPLNKDHLFPLFIVHEMPSGLRGFVLAGLLAAALSSHTSVLNALASTTVGDLYRPLLERCRRGSEEHFLRASRWATGVWGLVLVATAMLFLGSGENIIKLALKVLTYFYGGLLGVFLLGILSPRGSDRSAFAGLLLSVPVVLALQLREYVLQSSAAPPWVEGLVRALPGFVADALRRLPDIAWPLWIVVSTAVALVVGALGSRGRREPAR